MRDAATGEGGGSTTSGSGADTAAPLRSRVSPRWMRRIIIIAVVLLGFGVWGLIDATVVYPGRGEKAAQFLEHQFLQQLEQRRELTESRAAIKDPAAELQRLRAAREGTGLQGAEPALLVWLEQLALVGRLDASQATDIPRDDFRGERVESARGRLESLGKAFTSAQGAPAEVPSPLSAWDIPVQWLITAGGFGIGAYLLLLVARVRAKTFAFEPAIMRLTLPDGSSLAPADLEDVDKRRWHKFYCTLRVKPGHPTLGGKGVELDLMRYEPVEEWVLAMERAAFPDRAADDAKKAGDQPAAPAQGAVSPDAPTVVDPKTPPPDAPKA
ncbi:MAG: hypothetical protein SFY69_02340 [Planctomycetota bacterium]|nr:hypothetical protein [Planctomycetota bacterium]